MAALRPALALLLALSSCHRGEVSSAKTRESGRAAPEPAAQASAGGPRMKEHRVPPIERVGTLPPNVGISVGQQAPDATVHDADGREVSLRGLAGKDGRMLVAFYCGGWCPFCNFQIHELTTAYPELQRRGVLPVTISVDRPEESARIRATYTIPFPVLSDPDLSAHRAFRVLHHTDDAEVARLKGFGMDLERSSGQTHHVIAIPSMFLMDGHGVVRGAHADPDYKVRPSVAQFLAAIDGLRLPSP
jgi:peroxiredoxin